MVCQRSEKAPQVRLRTAASGGTVEIRALSITRVALHVATIASMPAALVRKTAGRRSATRP